MGLQRKQGVQRHVQGENPYTKELMQKYPNTLLKASGEAVGLPGGYQGNSEVGHMTMGAGRIFFQSLARINKDIASGAFFQNGALVGAIENCRRNNSALHILGLVQTEGVHAHLDHCFAILELCKRSNFTNVMLHVITDGRDAPPTDSVNKVRELMERMKSLGIGKIATISGRYYAMDRDKRWERTKRSYDAIVSGIAESYFTDPIACINGCYADEETDEFIVPRKEQHYRGVRPGDSIIFFNFRTDRTRQLTTAFIEERFEGWDRKPLDIYYVAMTEYYSPMNARAHIAYPNEPTVNLLGQVLADNGKRQLRISETEKYAHVTFFFNGQIEKPNKEEDRVLIPSPKVASYDLKPEMSAYEVGDRLVKEIGSGKYDVIIANFVNADMVGHTGVWPAILKAVKAVDDNVRKVVEKTLEVDGVVLILADHGCCEDKSPDHQTSHTTNLIPFVLVSRDPALTGAKLASGKGLQDVAPTVLKLLGIEKPKEMTGESLV